MAAAVTAGEAADVHRAEFRYGAVFVLVVALLVFVIIAPSGDATRAVVLALQGAALLVVVGTSRERPSVRQARVRALAVAAVVLVAAVALGALPVAVVVSINGLLALSVLVALVRGLLRLVRLHGVTLQVVAGALAIYVLVGLIFAWIISLVAKVGGDPFFSGGTDASQGDRVYYSFTVLTTTGFGDYTAATPVGHALSVLEMLLGQLYLVTVIGVIVGDFAGRSRAG
jgi:Ion channel